MRGLLFLGRVSFICNLFFVVCLLLRHTHFKIPLALNEFVIIVGWVLSVVVNFIFVITLGVLLYLKRKHQVPAWLVAITIFFFLFQIVYRLVSL